MCCSGGRGLQLEHKLCDTSEKKAENSYVSERLTWIGTIKDRLAGYRFMQRSRKTMEITCFVLVLLVGIKREVIYVAEPAFIYKHSEKQEVLYLQTGKNVSMRQIVRICNCIKTECERISSYCLNIPR